MGTSQTFYNYQVYCVTEGTYVNDGNYRLTLPTVCPNDPAHIINPQATIAVNSFTKNEVVIQESTTPNGGNFMGESATIVTPANSTSVTVLKYPFPIVALISYGNSGAEHVGDVISMSVNPTKPIAVLNADTTATTAWVSQNYVAGDIVSYLGEYFTCVADTDANQEPLTPQGDIQSNWWSYGYRIALNTTPQAMKYLYVGYFIDLTDGVNTDRLGRILSIDTVNNYLYMEIPPTNNYLTGNNVMLIIYTIKDYTIGNPGRTVIGEGKIGGKGIPARTPIHITYVNNSGTSKTLGVGFEYLY